MRLSFPRFLIYLNDDFEGGETTFYLPGASRLHAYRVRPRAGAVLCFPQSNTASLLHEGSAVTRGRKYVIRRRAAYGQPAKPRAFAHHSGGSECADGGGHSEECV